MRQAETALKDGRLDEAFELARVTDVRAHRRGQDLIGRLVRALAARGRGHLEAGRLAQASADCDKAIELGGNLPEAADLRSALEQAAALRREEERRKATAIGAAREHIHNGRLSIGGHLLADVDGTYRAEALRGEMEVRRAEVDAGLARIEEAMRHEDWRAAVESLAQVRQIHSSNPRLVELTAQLTGRLAERIRAALGQGRLDQARLFAEVGQTLCSQSVELAELEGVLHLAGRAAEAIRAGQCRRAIEILQQARSVVPEAGWLEQATAEAQRAAESMERLRGGPLGVLMASDAIDETVVLSPRAKVQMTPPNTPPKRPFTGRAVHPTEHDPALGGPLARRLMLHVDGIGSFLVLRDRSVTIGGAGGSRQPDVPLQMDCVGGPATIERTDEDYFMNCSRPVLVNNAPAERKLLIDGDRIALTPKCHVRFSVPNAASTSALLSIAGARLPGTDATRVILLDRSLVIGPGSSAHIRADDMPGPVIVHVRDGRLFCNCEQEITADGKPLDRQAGLPIGKQIRMGSLTMVIKPA